MSETGSSQSSKKPDNSAMASLERFKCKDCGHEFDFDMCGLAQQECPSCHSFKVERINELVELHNFTCLKCGQSFSYNMHSSAILACPSCQNNDCAHDTNCGMCMQQKFSDKKEETEDPREMILCKAIECVTKNRNKEYGEPEDNFRRIAGFMNAWLAEKLKDGEMITEVDVAGLSLCIKMGRALENAALADNSIDLAGYAACMYQVALKCQTET